VVLDVRLRSFGCVMVCMLVMAMGRMSVVSGLVVVTTFVVLGLPGDVELRGRGAPPPSCGDRPLAWTLASPPEVDFFHGGYVRIVTAG
jgi:hypothetical protein